MEAQDKKTEVVSRLSIAVAMAEAKKALDNPDTSPHVEVRALAGTGKTTTAVEGMALVKGVTPLITPSPQQAAVWDQLKAGRSDSIRFLAFGKAIATTLQTKLADRGLDRAGCEASTLHSLGFRTVTGALGRQQPTEWAVQDLVAGLLGKDMRVLRRDPKRLAVVKAVDELVGLCKQNLTDLSLNPVQMLNELVSHYDVELNGNRAEVYDLVPQVLDMCRTPNGRITYDDMVWLPVVLGLTVPKADLLVVDEAQDLNRMQQQLAYKAGHRIAFIGDPHQAIFGFAGADAESMNRLGRELRGNGDGRGCVTLPLTVTRRCGRAIVEEARQWVPEYEAHESNPDGEVRYADWPDRKGKDGRTEQLPWEKTYAAEVAAGDMVLCRTNAPLVSQCFRFLRRGIKANILGRDVGKGLIGTVNRLVPADQRPGTVTTLVGRLSDWLADETAKEQAKRNPSEPRLVGLQDRHDTLLCFTEGCRTADDVQRKIESVFTDDRNAPGVRFASIHKAKGLEADRVFFLQPPGAGPRADRMKAWEQEQEDNLKYVAVTRAINELIHVT